MILEDEQVRFTRAVSDQKPFVVGSTPPAFVNGWNWVTTSKCFTRWTKIVATKTARPRNSLCIVDIVCAPVGSCSHKRYVSNLRALFETCICEIARRLFLVIHAPKNAQRVSESGGASHFNGPKSLNWSDVKIIGCDDFTEYNALHYAEESFLRLSRSTCENIYGSRRLQMIHALRIQCDTECNLSAWDIHCSISNPLKVN